MVMRWIGLPASEMKSGLTGFIRVDGIQAWTNLPLVTATLSDAMIVFLEHRSTTPALPPW
jgi:hypothetical protein